MKDEAEAAGGGVCVEKAGWVLILQRLVHSLWHLFSWASQRQS